jgi:hypothetical protein
MENIMFRKALFALSALTVLGAAALAPTTASAGWKHHHGHHGHWGKSFYYGGPSYVAYTGYSTCWVKRWVDTPYGPRLQRFYVCY